MRRSDTAAILFFLLLALLFFAPVLFGNATLLPFDNLYRFPPWNAFAAQNGVTQPYNPLVDDLVLENYAWKQFILESLRVGELPLWNPYILAGQPFLAAGQNATLYPLGVVFYILPLTRAFGVFTALHFWLAACSMYFLARVLGLRTFAAIISGTIYAFSGFMVVSTVFPMVISAAAWLPAILGMAELAVKEEEKRSKSKDYSIEREIFFGIVAGILLGVQFLAGHVEISYYVLLVLAFYAAWRLIAISVQVRARRIEWGSVLRIGMLIVGIVALGFALAAIQLVPLYELVRLNFREGSVTYDQVAGWALPIRQIVTFLIPDFFGNPTSHAYFDIYERAWNLAPNGTIFWGIKNYVEAGAYVGILALVLAAIAVAGAIRNSKFVNRNSPAQVSMTDYEPRMTNYVALCAVLSLLSLLFAFGTPLYAILFYGLPGYGQLHTAFRWILPWTLSVAFLAGAGAQFLPSLIEPRKRMRWAIHLAWLLVIIGLVTLSLLALSLLIPEPFLNFANAFVNESDLAKPIFENGTVFWSYQFRNLAVVGLATLGAGLVLLAARSRRRVRNVPLWQPLSIGLVVLDLFIAGIGFYPRTDSQLAEFVPPAVKFLQNDRSLFRITSYDLPNQKVFNANAGMPFGISDIRGYDSIIPLQYVEYMRLLAPQDELLYNRIAAFYDYAPLSSPLLNLLNVKYVLTTRPVPNPGYKLVYDGDIKIYENSSVLPRAFLVTQGKNFESRADLVNALKSFDPTQDVFLESPSPPAPLPLGEGRGAGGEARVTGGEGSVGFEKYTGGEVIIKASSPQPAYLVLADSYFPGWIAQIDGQDTPIYRADGNFRAVRIPAGEHTVRFKYSPISFRVGAVMSLIAAIAVALACVALVWRRFVLIQADAGQSQVRTVAKNSLVPMGASLLIQVINFALALVVLRVLGPENNGRYAFAVTVWFFWSAVTEFGLNILVTREVARKRTEANRFLVNSALLRVALTVVSIVPLIGLMAAFATWSDLTTDTTAAILVLWLSLFPFNIAGALSNMFFAFERFEYPTAIEICTALVNVALQIAVLVAGRGIVGLAAVSIATNVFTLLVMYVLVRRLLFIPRIQFDRALLRWMFFESYPLMMNNLLANLFFKVDVFLLKPLAGDTVLGYYNASYKFVNALNFIPSKFTLAIFPLLSRASNNSLDATRRAMLVAVKLLLWIAVPITVATVLIAPQLILVFAGAAYLPDSGIALQWLIWFLPFSFVNSVVHYVLIALNEQRFLTRAFLIGLAFNIAANLLAIPPLTYRGAALVTVLSEVALLIPFFYALRRHFDSLPVLDVIWRPAVAGALMGGVIFMVLPINMMLALVVASLVYGLALFLLGAIGADEWLLIKRLMPHRFERVVGVLSRGAGE